ncbi:MAG: ATP-dependent DNA ligase [Brooklawnia sp.]|uniref:ATP-dependent DNA ligase n=1 Tax=Brooklawnia sp. TaxID=2699740 RepID=UPI003C782DB8
MGRVSLPLTLPIDPMLAKSVDQIPTGLEFIYEPKWDGFRCIISRDGDEVVLGSRGRKPLTVYFPEVVATLTGWLPDGVVLDAELVVRSGEPGAERLEWEMLSQRIHPAASRIRMLSEQTPAEVVCFDLLAAAGQDLTGQRWQQRRERLEALFDELPDNPSVHRSRYTTDVEVARRWFTVFEGAGLDGLIAKSNESSYQPGRRGWLKIKHKRTAEAVVIGYRVHKRGSGVGSLLLAMYDGQGRLVPVGGIGAFPDAMRAELEAELQPLVQRDEDDNPVVLEKQRSRFSSSDDQKVIALEPTLVVEVAFDQLEGSRFRHAAQLLRFRPERDAESCLLEQVERAPSYDLADVLAD